MDDAFPEAMMDQIREFFTRESNRAPGLDVYPDVFSCEGFFPLQRQAETARMIQTARAISPRVVFEIGADKGGGFYHWIKGISTIEKAIACEVRGTPYAKEFVMAFPGVRFCFEERSSYDTQTFESVRDFLAGDLIDVLFIDGDKANFTADFRMYLPLMRSPGGIIFMHDITDEAPGRSFLDAEPIAARSMRIIDTSDSIAAMTRPIAGSHDGWLRHWHGRSCGVGVLWL